MTSAAADRRQSRVYQAEGLVHRMFDTAERGGVRTLQAFGSSVTLPIERKFGSVDSVQAYVDAVLALAWVRERWPAAATPVTVHERRGQARSHYQAPPPTIALPPYEHGRAWALREFVVLHELAHHLVFDEDAGHGRPFVDTYVQLVGELIGPEAGFVLRAAMHENGAT